MGSYLSNFYWAPFIANGVEFKTSEHYFMYYKAVYFDDIKSADEILKAPEAKIAKALGRKIKNFDADQWSKISYNIMAHAVYHKFSNNILLKEQLLDTYPKVLVEASPLDKIWGVGLHEDDDLILDEQNWKGTNWLGKALMDVRNRLYVEN